MYYPLHHYHWDGLFSEPYLERFRAGSRSRIPTDDGASTFCYQWKRTAIFQDLEKCFSRPFLTLLQTFSDLIPSEEKKKKKKWKIQTIISRNFSDTREKLSFFKNPDISWLPHVVETSWMLQTYSWGGGERREIIVYYATRAKKI